MSADVSDLFKEGILKELETLHKAVRDFAEPLTEDQFWRRPLEPSNSVGHLVLHLTGNLSWFVGAKLGGTGYVRDREREFTEANVPPKAAALARLDETVTMVRRVVSGLTPDQLAAPHPEARFGPVAHALVTLLAHFALHRGQMSYLTRLVAGGT